MEEPISLALSTILTKLNVIHKHDKEIKLSEYGRTPWTQPYLLYWINFIQLHLYFNLSKKKFIVHAFLCRANLWWKILIGDFLSVSKQTLSKNPLCEIYPLDFLGIFLQQFVKCTEIEENHAVSSFFLCRVTRWNISA